MTRDSSNDDDRTSDAETVRATVDGLLGGLGKISSRLGDVAELAGKAIDEARDRQASGQTSGQADGAAGGASGVVYDVTVRMGLGDEAERVVRGFERGASATRSAARGATRTGTGAKPATRSSPSSQTSPQTAAREPWAEILREGDTLVVVLDMPGVDAGDVDVQHGPGSLVVTAEGASRRWKKSLEVAELTSEHQIYVTAKNGIVRLEARPAPSADANPGSATDS